MPKVNYRLMMDRELSRIGASGEVPSLLLHVCCAPCSSGCLEELCRYFRVTCWYYNPNISPESEYERRAAELRRFLAACPLSIPPRAELAPYDPAPFEALARGLEDLPEGGERCTRCYRLRLEQTALKAAREGYDYFTTTLSVSPYKDAERLNRLGGELAEAYGVRYLFSDFKKNDGYLRSIRMSAEYGLYRQAWCGCVYSKRDSEEKMRRQALRTRTEQGGETE